MSVALAAPHAEAVRAGEDAVAAGGNALDAALAAAAMLSVVYPHQCAVGGDLIALVRTPAGHTHAVLAAGTAPAAVDAVSAGWSQVPRFGAHSVSVPGMFGGWQAIHDLGATRPLSEVLLRAADRAEQGTPVSAGLARALTSRAPAVFADEGLRKVFAPDGRPLTEGELLVQPALARTFTTLAADPDSFYRGSIARALVRALQSAHGVHIAEDFSGYSPEVVPALRYEAGESMWSVAPPPSAGAILLGVIAGAVGEEGTRDERVLAASVRGVHTRAALLADPAGADVVIDDLIGLTHTSGGVTGEPRPQGDTAAVVATDDEGWSVSIVQSVYMTFGSGLLDPETGILFHNRASAFSADPRHPAFIRPGLRPPHTLTPAIVDSEDTIVVAGCQGGRAQPWILAQLLPDAVAADSSLDEILSRARWVVGERDLGHAVLTAVTEPGVTENIATAAATLGISHATFPGPADEAGHVQLVRRTGPRLDAASDPRADGIGVVI
ncbi:gamma-glutamyltransferase [Microbacterium sediminicola]|uniref:Gamma-glutamyltransferase n=1 Tax=Microbacterium sediminicola TaxID=415210 RepID=A0ABP4TH16_9MICO